MTDMLLVLVGLIEFIFRIVFVLLMVCSVIGLFLLLDDDIADVIAPLTWQILRERSAR